MMMMMMMIPQNQVEKVEKVEAQKEVEQGVGDGFPLEKSQIWRVQPLGFLYKCYNMLLNVHTISRISQVNVGQLHHATSNGGSVKEFLPWDPQMMDILPARTRKRRKNRGFFERVLSVGSMGLDMLASTVST